MRIAVIGDIHANATALEAGLRIVDERGCDLVIFLGDLLTYGPDIVETIAIINRRIEKSNAILLRGNHDAMYSDLLKSDCTYFNQLPPWIKESVSWTFEKLPVDIWAKLAFRDEYVMKNFLFSHANPFGIGVWKYLNCDLDHQNASLKLEEQGFNVGVFGHTHRTKWYRFTNGVGHFAEDITGVLSPTSVHVLNAGSIGQPREVCTRDASILWVDIPDAQDIYPAFEMQRFSWDLSSHLQRLNKMDISKEALIKIQSFLSG